MRPVLGVAGHAACDLFFPHATHTVRDRSVEIRLPDRLFQVETLEPVQQGGKVDAALPGELWRLAADSRAGGGGVNSCLALKLAAPDLAIRYLDAARPDEELQRQLCYPGLEFRSLNLRPIPRNVVLGDGKDRLILKTPLMPAAPFSTEHVAKLAWLSQCSCVLANSVKDTPIMEYLVRAASEGKIELLTVATRSLPADFLLDTVLPASRIVFVAWDDLSHLVGFGVPPDSHSAAEALHWLCDGAKRATIYLTLGSKGVLVGGPDADHFFRVQLRPERSGQVGTLVAHSSRLCGAGDAFAGGAVAYQQTGESSLRGLDGHHHLAVAAALAGCATAVGWSGWRQSLCADDFVVQTISRPLKSSGVAGVPYDRRRPMSWVAMCDAWIGAMLAGEIEYDPRRIETRELAAPESAFPALRVILNANRKARLAKAA